MGMRVTNGVDLLVSTGHPEFAAGTYRREDAVGLTAATTDDPPNARNATYTRRLGRHCPTLTARVAASVVAQIAISGPIR